LPNIRVGIIARLRVDQRSIRRNGVRPHGERRRLIHSNMRNSISSNMPRAMDNLLTEKKRGIMSASGTF
jgi:hypothetical protein